jgi:uncharacterized coiled-coil protein SlyX
MSERGARGRSPRTYEDKKKADGRSQAARAADDRSRRIADLEARIAEHEGAIKTLESRMAEPGFYDERGAAEDVITRHQKLMWEVGDLMNQWEVLQSRDLPQP